MDRLPFLPDPERLKGLWSASGVEAADPRQPQPSPGAPGRIRFGAAPAPQPQVVPVPPPPPARDTAAGLQRSSIPLPPPAPVAPEAPAAPPAPPVVASPAKAGTPIPLPPSGSRVPVGPPLPPRVPGPPAPAVAAAAAALSGPARPSVPAVPDEMLAAQIFGGAPRAIDARLQRLLEYTGRTLQASAAFIADSDGLTVASLRSNDALAAVTAPLGGVHEKIAAFVPASREGGAVVELDEQGVLQLVWAVTEAGRLALGMVLQSPLDRGSTRKLRRMVQLAVDTKGTV